MWDNVLRKLSVLTVEVQTTYLWLIEHRVINSSDNHSEEFLQIIDLLRNHGWLELVLVDVDTKEKHPPIGMPALLALCQRLLALGKSQSFAYAKKHSNNKIKMNLHINDEIKSAKDGSINEAAVLAAVNERVEKLSDEGKKLYE